MFEGLFSRVVGKVVYDLSAAQSDPALAGLGAWFGKIQEIAFARWAPVMRSGMRCALRIQMPGGVSPCRAPAIAGCAVCARPVCAAHALIGMEGDVLCGACAVEAVKVLRARAGGAPATPQGPTEAELKKKYLRVLGLKEPTDWAEISEAFRKKAAKAHPDRAAADKREQATQKFKEINAAFQWLRPKYEKAA